MEANNTPRPGEQLPLVEDFYSIQGEGFHSGKPAYFVRLGDCSVGCRWCDAKQTWREGKFPLVAVTEIVARVLQHPAQAVVVTGGEPLNHSLDLLCALLQSHNLQTLLETSGTQPLSGAWTWICLSPKPQQPPLEPIFAKANELKVIVETTKDFAWAERCAAKVSGNCLLYLQPEWSVRQTIMPAIVDYAKQHPQWNISLQTHKFIDVP